MEPLLLAMSRSSTSARRRPANRRPAQRPAGRRPAGRQSSWLARNRATAGLLAAGALVAVAVVVVVASRGGGGDDGSGGLTGGDFHSLVVDPADPQRIFVGGHTAVSVSADGGVTWQEVDSLTDADAMGWTFTSDAVYVGGHPGLNRSTDDAASFEQVNDGLPSTDVHAFGGTDGMLYGSSPAVGFFAGDVGDWEVRSTAAGQSFFGRIVADPDDDTHLFAADASAGVAESSDGGRTWQILDSGLPAATWLSRGGDGLAVLVASGPAGAALSRDAGRTWERLEIPAGNSLVEAVPGDPDLLYLGTHDGNRVQVQTSRDSGRTWSTP